MVLLILPACNDARQSSWMPEDGAVVPILRQYAGMDCGEPAAMQTVVRTADQWLRVPWINEPVDWDKEMALALTLGPVVSDQHSVRITRVWRAGRQLRVAVASAPPPPGAPLVRASPYCIAIVPMCELGVAGFSGDPPPLRIQRGGDVQREAPAPPSNRPSAPSVR